MPKPEALRGWRMHGRAAPKTLPRVEARLVSERAASARQSPQPPLPASFIPILPPSCSGGESKPPRGAGDALPFPSLPSSRSEAGWAVMLRGFPGCSEGAPLPPAAGISPLGGPGRGLAAGGGRGGGDDRDSPAAPRSRLQTPGAGGAGGGRRAICCLHTMGHSLT